MVRSIILWSILTMVMVIVLSGSSAFDLSVGTLRLLGGPGEVKFEAAGGGEVSTMISQTTADQDTLDMYNTADTAGQSFKATNSDNLYSITIQVDEYEGTPSLSMRWGTAEDLSSVYTQEVAFDPGGTGDYEVVLSGDDAIVNGTTYYFAVRNDTSLYANRVELKTNSSSVYADGAGTHHAGNGDDWNNYIQTGDLYFIVKTVN